MKKKILLFMFVSALIITLTGCGKKLKSILIEGDNEIAINATSTLKLITDPENATIKNVNWSSSDESILTVKDGIITGVSEGKATIVATTENDIKAYKDIEVFIPTESITIDKNKLNLSIKEEQKIVVTIIPENSIYTLESENENIAIVSPEGIIAAVDYGTTKITVTSRDKKEAICEVVVSVTVPDFNTLSWEDAKKWGTDNKVTIKTDTEYSETIKRDKIISQSIPAGTEITENGKTIEIIYSLGHKPTLGESNALDKAQDYLDYMAFSAKGLKRQLEYEGFSSSEAQYAVDNCGADWNEQAAKKAKSYLEYMSFSRSGLKRQLLYEGFTEKQAEYGLKAVGY